MDIYIKSCDIRDCYIGVVGRMASEGKESGKESTEARKRGPVIQPSDFSGSGEWTTWSRKFQHLAELYTWSDLEKLIWLESKLNGQAGRAFETLDKSAKDDFSAVVDALTRRLEPEAKQQLFQEKLLTYILKRKKMRTGLLSVRN